MSREEGPFNERVGARISPELKARVQEAITKNGYDSEADVVREALWLYVEQNEQVEKQLHQINQQNESLSKAVHDGDESHHDRIEWALTVVVILVALVGSKILNTIREEKVKPAELADEAIQETVYNWSIFWKKMRAGRWAALQLPHHNGDERG
jgi:Arc/MetJ-type ribon-helix-helix transcriptional regulator